MQPYDRNRSTLTATVRKMRVAEQKPKVKTVRCQPRKAYRFLTANVQVSA